MTEAQSKTRACQGATAVSLSKTKIMAFRQCPRRLWLEVHKPELRIDSASTLASFAVGHSVGEIARRIYDPESAGSMIDVAAEGYEAAFARTTSLLGERRPIFEAGFSTQGGLAFADVMLPSQGSPSSWRMVEVKSATKVKEYHLEDLAVQAYLAQSAGVDSARFGGTIRTAEEGSQTNPSSTSSVLSLLIT